MHKTQTGSALLQEGRGTGNMTTVPLNHKSFLKYTWTGNNQVINHILKFFNIKKRSYRN